MGMRLPACAVAVMLLATVSALFSEPGLTVMGSFLPAEMCQPVPWHFPDIPPFAPIHAQLYVAVDSCCTPTAEEARGSVVFVQKPISVLSKCSIDALVRNAVQAGAKAVINSSKCRPLDTLLTSRNGSICAR
jgi:hypothetical protein